MTLKGSGVVVPTAGAWVTHPLWPELGVGLVLTASKAVNPGARVGRIRWATDQLSTHNLATLKEVES
jgi:hypothetical protein